jgi:hypothetical protein
LAFDNYHVMKKKYLLSVIFLLFVIFISHNGYAQRILGAVSAGMNLTQVDGDEKYGFKKVGLNIGPSVIIPFGKSKKWSVTMELLFSQLGSHQKEQYANDTAAPLDSGYYDGYKLKLNYVQIPVMVHFKDKNIIAGGVGFQYGQLVGAQEWQDYNDSRGLYKVETTTLRSPYTMSDLQVIVDVRLRLYQRLWFNFRYAYSVYMIRTRDFVNPVYNTIETRHQYNNVISMRLTYIFNEEIIKKGSQKKTE